MKTLKALTRAFTVAVMGVGLSAGALAEGTISIGFSGPFERRRRRVWGERPFRTRDGSR